jgi:hypothetical protein
MLRRLAPLALALIASAAAADDLPPWAQPAPSGASAPAGATAATEPAATKEAETFGELLALRMKPEEAARLRKDTPEQRAKWLAEQWAKLPAHQRAQVEFAGRKLREPGGVANARALTLLVLGPPEAIHSEPAHAWSAATVERIDDLGALGERLTSGSPAATTMTLDGDLPTEIWVYPGATLNELRTIVFVDEDRDGGYRFAQDRVVPASEFSSSVPAADLPSDLFPPVAITGDVDPLPALSKAGLPIKIVPSFFKASAGRTFTRFLLVVDPSDVEIELGGDSAAFGAAAEAWLRVEQGGKPVWQGHAPFSSMEATASTPWLAELSVPLPPGAYKATAIVLDGQAAGGSATADVDVPAYGGKLAASTAVVARVGSDGLPRVPPATGAEGEGLKPFQVGNYVVRPALGGSFKRGDSIAFVVQVYDAPSATVTYRLNRDGVFQSELDPFEIKLPATQIQLVDIGPEFTDGAYEMRVTVTNAKNPSESVVVPMPFRVRG